MGKIPEYQRSKFVSEYVGAPQLDSEGMEIAKSVGDMTVAAAGVQAQKLGEQAQVRIDQQANNALLKYSLAYQQQAKVLKEQYADNPQDYPEALANLGTEMQAEFTDRIPDERIKARFGGAATTLVRSGVGPSMAWATEKEKENGLIAYTGNLDIAVQTAGEQDNRIGFWGTLNTISDIASSNLDLTAKERRVYLDTAVKQATENYYINRASEGTPEFIKELDTEGNNTFIYQGEDGVKHTLTVSPKEVKGYRKLAVDALENRRERDKFNQLINSSGRSFEMLEGYQNGKFGLTEVAQYENAVRNDKSATTEEKENASLLLRTARTDIRKTGVINFSKIAFTIFSSTVSSVIRST